MWEAIEKPNLRRDIIDYRLAEDGVPMTWAAVLHQWANSPTFADFFTGLIRNAPFAAVRWETPGLTTATMEDPFEFVLVRSDGLDRPPDSGAFDRHFEGEGGPAGVVRFTNLGGDAELVVPTPSGTGADDFAHLQAFLRMASREQIRALWRTVGEAAQQRVSDTPVWISTAGAGVPWLHVRLDDRPKYYSHAPYRTVPER